MKGSRRVPLEFEKNSTSCNLVFSVGAWLTTVLPAFRYWEQIKGEKTCRIRDKEIRVTGTKSGKDSNGMCVVSQVIFYSNRDKIVLHLYNTTQRVLVNGHGYEEFVVSFLKPFFEAKVQEYPNEISNINNEVIKKFGPKTVKRSSVKYKGGSVFSCNQCETTFKSQMMLNKHKDNDHALSFNKAQCLPEPRQSTRNSSLLMLENISSTGLEESLSLDEKAPEFTCKDSYYEQNYH